MQTQNILYVDHTSYVDIGDIKPALGSCSVRLPGYNVRVWVSWTGCHLGGKRPWFLCPECGLRRLRLYGLICRQCRKLRYRCKSESPGDRAIRRAIRHREKFGQTEGGLLVDFPAKPYGMTWAKYWRGYEEHLRLDALALGAFKLPEPIKKRSASMNLRGN